MDQSEESNLTTNHGPVTCRKCKTAHPEVSEQAEFIAWNGHCAVCELTDMDADLASRARHE